MCLTTKAVPKSAERLRSRRRASNEENWFCQSVQRKKNESIQRRSPASGSTELNACADAKKSDASVSACETFSRAVSSEESQRPSSIARPRTKSARSIEASISVTSGGGRNASAPPSAPTRTPPASAAVRKSVGSSRCTRSARFVERRGQKNLLSRETLRGVRGSALRSLPLCHS